MSPTLNRSSTIQQFEYSDGIEICNGIIFDFYTGLPRIIYMVFTGVGTMECAPQILIRYPSNSVATLTDTRWSAHSTLPFGEGPSSNPCHAHRKVVTVHCEVQGRTFTNLALLSFNHLHS